MGDSGPDWRRIIVFGDKVDPGLHHHYVSPKMRRRYGVTKTWMRDMIKAGKMTDELKRDMDRAADAIVIESLREKCKRESLFSWEKPSCKELREHGIYA
jgi:hypothetical protein